MAKQANSPIIVPILIITLGVGWLLTTQGFGPSINWVWTMGLGVVGVLIFALTGIDKFSVVVGPFFIIASGCSILRQMEYLPVNVEVPSLVIAMGFLLLLARLPVIPSAEWTVEPEPLRTRAANPNP